MRIPARFILTIFLTVLAVVLVSCGSGGPPQSGQEISFPDQGVSIRVTSGWVAEVVGTDWTMWERIQKGRADDPWVFPPVTVTKVSTDGYIPGDRPFVWRFKGVEGTFDPSVSPSATTDTVPSGLWALDPLKLDLINQQKKILDWPGLSGVEATTRLYENTHGMGPTASLWHTYTVTFGHGTNTYEFVMQIPADASYRKMIDEFWGSIVDMSIEE